MKNYQHELELSLYPQEYTLAMSIENNNIVKYGAVSYNSKRMQLFMYNYLNRIPDKIVIVDYGIDGYPTISILQYTGNFIIYTERYYTDNIANFQTFLGYNIIERYRKNKRNLIRDYNLITCDNKEIPVFRDYLVRLKN